LRGGERQRAAAGRSVSFAQNGFAHFQTKGTKKILQKQIFVVIYDSEI